MSDLAPVLGTSEFHSCPLVMRGLHSLSSALGGTIVDVFLFFFFWFGIGFLGGLSRRAWYEKRRDALNQNGLPSRVSTTQLVVDTIFGPFTVILRLRNGSWG